MDYMDPDVLCPPKADKLNLFLSLSRLKKMLVVVYVLWNMARREIDVVAMMLPVSTCMFLLNLPNSSNQNINGVNGFSGLGMYLLCVAYFVEVKFSSKTAFF